jgi:hypothetical protein
LADENSVTEVAKRKSLREKAVDDYDGDRELLRLEETGKKVKPAEIAKVRQKCEDAHSLYEAANDRFIEAVNALDES